MPPSNHDRVRSLLNRAFSLGAAPLSAAYLAERRLMGDEIGRRLIGSYGGLIGMFPGFSGDFLRRAFYQRVLRRLHPTVTISHHTLFSSEDVEIDEGVYIGGGCSIGRCRIGKHAMLSDYVVVIPGRHSHRFDQSGVYDPEVPGDEIPIRIGAHSWIGAHAVVMADVGDRTTIGAGAVVVKPIPDDMVAVGNPARVVRRRQ